MNIMYKLCLFFLTIFSLVLTSQEFSEEYLASLPDEIRNDILARANEKEDFEDDVYRSIDNSSDLLKDQDDLSDQVFGSNFFNTIQTSFMPINSPNLDDSYILDFGDVLNIQLIGQNDSIDEYIIARDGSINIPEIGKLYLSGLSLRNASEMINSKAQQTYIGTKTYTSLKNLRDISVLVAGNAYSPGVYTLNGSSNMLHALHAAGGVSEFGSYRSIKLIRNNEIIEIMDLYDILINGQFNVKTRLRSGDTIFVDQRGLHVTLEGAFKRNSIYELLDDEHLYDAFDFANGLVQEADKKNIVLYRLLDGEVKPLPISNISQFKKIKANDKDRIYVRKHSFRNIEISGAVLNPGNYTMIEGETIFDLLDKAGGYTLNANPYGAIYLNEGAKNINKEASEKLYNNFIETIFSSIQQSSSGGIDFVSLTSIAKELKEVEPYGRIIIDLYDESYSPMVQDNDSLFIPEKTNNIFIFGEVINQGSALFVPGADLDYYINVENGLKDSADKNSIYILYPNGRTKKFKIKRNLFASQPQKIEILPGSVIYVPKKIDNALARTLSAQAYATILGNIGLSLASLSAIND